MKTFSKERRDWAMTLFEVLIIVAILMVFVILLLPVLGGAKAKSSQIGCNGRLKQVGLAYRIWAADHYDKFPMEISTASGGTMEYASGSETFRHFQVMSNELSTPKILVCPKDPSRKRATTFAPSTTGSPPDIPFSNNSQLSYFVGLNATSNNPSAFLSGDRNITNGTALNSGVLELTTNRLSGWTEGNHVRQGNVGLADGSVQGFTTTDLRRALGETGIATNRLAMP